MTLEKKKDSTSLMDNNQFDIKCIRFYRFIDRIIEFFGRLFKEKKIYTRPEIFEIVDDFDGSCCNISAIPGKEIQEVLWRQDQKRLAEEPPVC